jgi:DNA helicase HerA-like ATPase
MTEQRPHLESLIDQTERIGVIGSPSSTAELALDILGVAVTRKLVGEFALFRFLQDGAPHYGLGQITEVQLRNVWHEDPTMRSLIRQRGRVDAISERQDTHLGKMIISAVFKARGMNGYEPSILGTVPPTGTPIHIIDDAILQTVLSLYQNQLFFLGHIYGSKPRLPLWFKHFDRGPDGAGEAYHLGIFGKTGSGKSVLAKMILLAYARHPHMALLVIDPQGEFARDVRSSGGHGDFALPIKEIMQGLGKKSLVMTVQNLVLDRWELFEQILYESPFFERLSMTKGENRQIACSVLRERLEKRHVKLSTLWQEESFEIAWTILKDDSAQKIFYRSDASRDRFTSTLLGVDKREFFEQYWSPVALLFREERDKGRRSVDEALRWLLDPSTPHRPLLVVDLSREKAGHVFWNERIQSLVIKRLLDGLTRIAESFYKDDQSLNTLVVIDEAHRLAPRELLREDDAARSVRDILVDAARTTRKYGLGWLFISQTLSSIDQEILQQLRILFFGFGLGLGQEFVSLRQLVGSAGTALDLYQSFRDPHSSFDISNRQYSFMTIGPVSPLSFSGSPLFFNAFNNVNDFLAANHLKRG